MEDHKILYKICHWPHLFLTFQTPKMMTTPTTMTTTMSSKFRQSAIHGERWRQRRRRPHRRCWRWRRPSVYYCTWEAWTELFFLFWVKREAQVLLFLHHFVADLVFLVRCVLCPPTQRRQLLLRRRDVFNLRKASFVTIGFLIGFTTHKISNKIFIHRY